MRLFLLGLISFLMINSSFGADFYWKNGSGRWDDPSHWSVGLSNSNAKNLTPGKSDNVYILKKYNSNPFQIELSSSVSISKIVWEVGEIDGGDELSIGINGDVSISSEVVDNFKGKWVLYGDSKVNISHALVGNLVVNGNVTLQSDLSTQGMLRIESGNFYASNLKLNINTFSSSKKKQTINIQNSELTINKWDVPASSDRTVSSLNNVLYYTGKVIPQLYFDKNFNFAQIKKIGNEKSGASVGSVDLKHPCDAIQGEITANASGGSADYNYQLIKSPGDLIADYTVSATSFTFTKDNISATYTLDANDYVVLIDGDAAGVTLKATTALAIPSTDVVDVTTVGGSDGKITVHATGGYFGVTHAASDIYTYTLTVAGAQSDSLFTGLVKGTYDVTVSDPNSMCVDVTKTGIQVNEPAPAATISDVTVTDVTCNGYSDGSIVITASGSGTLYYSIDNGTTWQASNTFSGLSAGSGYNVAVKDDNGTTNYASNPVTVSEPTALSYDTEEITQITCHDMTNGKVVIKASGGTKNYQYTLKLDGGATTGPQADSTFSNLAAGKYFGTVTDLNGCTAESGKIVIVNPDDFGYSTPRTTIVDVQPCAWSDNGSLTIHAYKGAQNIYYSIDNGATYQADSVFDPIVEKSYDIMIKNEPGCEIAGGTYTVNGPDSLAISSVNVTDITTCAGNAEGGVTINVDPANNGEGTIVYSINGDVVSEYAANGGTFTNQLAGNYDVWVQDNNGSGCKLNYGSVTIHEPDAVVVDNIAVTDVTCNGDSDGSIVITAHGGTGSLHYSIDGGTTWQAGNSFNTLSAQSYNVSVKDDNDCQKDTTATVNEPAKVTFTTNVVDVNCNGDSDGSISITASNGVTPYQYSDDGGTTWQAGSSFSGLSAGNYNIQVKDANSCTSDVVITTVGEPTSLTFTTSVTDVSCNGASDGAIQVSASGGTSPYQYSNDGGTTWQAGNTFSSLAAGDYDIQVKDSHSCTSSVSTTTVSQPGAITFTTSVSDVTCNGGSDGSITVTPSGGTTPYQYSDDGGTTWQGANSFSGLSANSYNVQVKDAHGCTSGVTAVVVNEATEVTFTSSVVDASCNGGSDGSITITASGGTGPYQYSKDGGTNWQASNSFSGLSANSYNVQVKDANSCTSAITAVVVGEASAVVLLDTTVTNVSCHGDNDGSIVITASGGTGPYKYSNDGGTSFQASNTFSGLTAGVYNVQIQDANTCTSNVYVISVTEPNEVTFTTNKTDVTCNGDNDGKIVVIASGGTSPFKYSKDGGTTWQTSNTFNSLTAATYNIQVKDVNDCMSAVSGVTISEPSSVTFTTTTIDATCNGANDGSISVSASGGTSPYEYSKDGGTSWQASSTFTSLTAATYNVQVRDVNHCTSGVSAVVINEPTAITFTTSITDVTCNGGSDGAIQVSASGGAGSYEYSKDGGTSFQAGNTFSGLSAGSYNIQVRDGSLCTSAVVATVVSEPDEVTFTTSVTDVSCNGDSDGSIVITATGGTSPYQYSDDGGTTWQAGNTFSGLSANSYNIQVKDVNSCPSAITAVVVNQPDAVTFTTSVTNVSCNGGADGSISVSATGGTSPYQYSGDGGTTWQAGNTFSGLSANSYNIQVKDAHSCTSSISAVSVTEPSAVTFTTSVTDVSCNGDSDGQIAVTASGGTAPYTYSNDGGATFQASNTFTNLSANTYNIQVKDVNDCTSGIVANVVNEPTAITFTAAVTDNTCNGGNDGKIVVTPSGGTPAYEYSKDGGSTWQSSDNLTNLAAGNYDVQVRDANHCTSAITTIAVGEPAPITFSATVTDVTCYGDTDGKIEVNGEAGGTAPYTYSIDTANTWQAGNSFTSLAPASYGIMLKDASGCESAMSEFVVGQPDSISVSLIDSLLSCGSLAVIEGDTLALPDGTGATYESTLTYTEFGATQKVNAATDLQSIYLNIEHSWLSDLDVDIVCPNGQSVSIMNQQGQARDLGEPVPDESGVAGNGYLYSFSSTATDTWSSVVGNSDVHEYVDNKGDTIAAAKYIPAGEYQPIGDMNSLVGCPLNGDWKIKIKDNNAFDDGYLFKWGIRFAPSTYPSNYCNGMLQVAATGGNGGFSYLWSDGQSTNQASSLCADEYTVTVTDGAGCTATYKDSVRDVDIKLIVTDTTHVLCAGDNTGSATVSAEGGNEPYKFAWASGDTANSQSNMTSGLYYVTVIDANGCEQVDSLEIKTLHNLQLSFIDTVNIKCSPLINGDSTGGITAHAFGGVAPYTFAWSSSDGNDSVATHLTAGWNYVTVSDANCSVVDSVQLSAPSPIAISVIDHQDVGCLGDSSGVIQVAVVGGTNPLGMEWSNGETNVDKIDTLVAGSYTVTVTDANACWQDTTVNITEPLDTISFDVSITNANCGASDGAASVANLTGGTPPYVLTTWYNSSMAQIGTGSSISNLALGSYYVGVDDSNGCSTIKPFEIKNNSTLSISGLDEIQGISCNGTCDASYKVQVTGGVQPLNFSWSNGQTEQTAVSMCGDSTYWVVVTDANTCKDSVSFFISQPTTLTVAITDSSDATCWGEPSGQAVAKANGGTSPYTYVWLTNSGDTVANTDTAFNLYGDTLYNVKAIDANGCEAVASITLSQPASAVSATVDTTHTSCGGNSGTATVTPVGGTPYTSGDAYIVAWEDGQTGYTATNLGVGQYKFTVTDSLGCTYIDTAIIENNSDLAITVDSTHDAICYGECNGTALITVSGGSGNFSYMWSNGVALEDAIDTLCSGVNTITVTDNTTTCTATANVTIGQPTELKIDTVYVTDALCNSSNNGKAVIIPSGGTPEAGLSPYGYQWADGATDSVRTDLVAGDYTVTLYDASNCEATYSFTVGEPNAISYDVTVDSADCGSSNGTLTLSNVTVPSGNFEVKWSYPSWTADSTGLSITNLEAGNYTVTITDTVNGCDTVASVVLPDKSDLQISLINKTDVSCFGTCDASASISVAGGTPDYTYQWSNGDTLSLADSLCGGAFTVTVTDANSCKRVYNDSIQQPDAINVSYVYTDSIQCAGDTITELYAVASGGVGGFTYRWGDTASNLISTDSSATLVAGTKYYITVNDAHDCSIVDSLTTISEPSAMNISITSTTTNCPEDSSGTAKAVVSGGVAPYIFNWYIPNEPTAVFSGASTDSIYDLYVGTYVVEVTDNLGCVAYDTVNIQSNTDFSYDVEVLKEVYCIGTDDGSATITNIVNGSGSYNYMWASGETVDTAVSLFGGIQNVTVTDNGSGCAVIKQFTLPNDNALFVAYNSSVDYITGDLGNGFIELSVSGGTPPYTYKWEDSLHTSIDDTDSIISNLNKGWYYWTVTDASPCSWVDSAYIDESPIIYDTVLIKDVSCFQGDDGYIEILPHGGIGNTPDDYTITWSNDSVGTSISNLVAGIYKFTISDGGIYAPEFSIEVTQPDSIILSYNIQQSDCSSPTGQIIVDVTQGGTEPFEFTWEYNGYPVLGATGDAWAWPSDTTVVGDTIKDLHVGKYIFTMVDAGGCSYIDSVFVDDNSTFVLNAGAFNPKCYGESSGIINLYPANGTTPYDYNWAHDATLTDKVTNLSAGTYSVTVIDADMCVEDSTFVLTEPDSIVFSLSDLVKPVCYTNSDGAVTIHAQGGNGGFTYGVKLIDSTSYTNFSDSIINTLSPGQYNVLLMDQKGCFSDIQSFTLESTSPQMLISPVAIDNPNCPHSSDGAVTVSVKAGMFGSPIPVNFNSLSFVWRHDTTTVVDSIFTSASAGLYSVKVTDDAGCSDSTTINLQSDTLIHVNPFVYNVLDNIQKMDTIEACKNDLIKLDAAPGANLLDGTIIKYDTAYWSGGIGLAQTGLVADSAFVNDTVDAVFKIKVQAGSCFDMDSVLVKIPNIPDVSIESSDPDNRIYQNNTIELSCQDYTVLSFIDSTIYYWDEYIELTHNKPDVPTLSDTTGYSVSAKNILDSTIYRVFVKNKALSQSDRYCLTKDSIKIAVIGEFKPLQAFTPNGDGKYDYWTLPGIDPNDTKFKVTIVNRWGQVMFESSDAMFMSKTGWDGKNKNGKEVGIGSYFYVVEYYNGNRMVQDNGILTVIR